MKPIREIERFIHEGEFTLEDEPTPYGVTGDEFEPDVEDPTKTVFPRYVGERARKEYVSVMQQFINGGVATPMECTTILVYARCVERYHEFEEKFNLGEYEWTSYDSRRGFAKSPEAVLHSENIRVIKEFGSQLGVTPNARKNMKLAPKTKEEEPDPLLDFVKAKARRLAEKMNE